MTLHRAKRNLAAGRFVRAVLQFQPEGEPVLRDIHKRALQRAAVIVGGNEELRVHLGASETDFASWPAKRELPRDIFLRLVDIITKEEVRNVQGYRPARKALASS